VCACTGSGKTLAFYLPALLHIAPRIEADSWWVKCLAIYPRNELLKDQFTETYLQARRIDESLASHGRRKLSIGALFGAVPTSAGQFFGKHRPEDWRRTRDGYVCPYLRCPGCDGEMAWRDEHREMGIERLTCTADDCRAVVTEDEVVLTRERLLKTPPPLPEFVPRALFNDLNAPEVTVRIDAQQQDDEDHDEPMRLVQALREYAPGRVSRRFGIRHRYARHWIAPASLDAPAQDLPLADYLTNWEELGDF